VIQAAELFLLRFSDKKKKKKERERERKKGNITFVVIIGK